MKLTVTLHGVQKELTLEPDQYEADAAAHVNALVHREFGLLETEAFAWTHTRDMKHFREFDPHRALKVVANIPGVAVALVVVSQKYVDRFCEYCPTPGDLCFFQCRWQKFVEMFAGGLCSSWVVRQSRCFALMSGRHIAYVEQGKGRSWGFVMQLKKLQHPRMFFSLLCSHGPHRGLRQFFELDIVQFPAGLITSPDIVNMLPYLICLCKLTYAEQRVALLNISLETMANLYTTFEDYREGVESQQLPNSERLDKIIATISD